MISVKVPSPGVASPKHGLVDGGNIITTKPDSVWEDGVTFRPEACLALNANPAGICLADPGEPEFTDCSPWISFKAYNLEISVEWSVAEDISIEDTLLRAIDAGTSSKLERLIWDGHADVDSPVLTDAIVINDSATPAQALGILDAALRSSTTHVGSRGTIHMSSLLATLVSDQLRVDDSGLLQTKTTGNVVIVGDYDHDLMVGHAGTIDVYLGEPEILEAVEEARRYNNHVASVQRAALAAWHTCAAYAVPVTGTGFSPVEPES